MDSVGSVDMDVARASDEAERIRQLEEQRKADEARQAQIQQAQASASRPEVRTATDVLGTYVNLTA
jgi:hypothetical protein